MALFTFAVAGSAAAMDGVDDTASDRIALESAATACKAGDPRGFFDAFIQSKAVRKKYSAPSIEYVLLRSDFTVDRWDEVKADDYAVFPITMVDHYRKSAQPISADQDEHVVIELNQSQSEAFAVEWTRVTYDGLSAGGDDMGTAYRLDGERYMPGNANIDGQLLFVATGDCWQFSTDTRHYQNYPTK
jgi:hypothetical protein